MLVPQLPPGNIQINLPEEIRWGKAPCRFWGTGSSVLISGIGNQIANIKSAPESPANRGMLCVNGYNLLKVVTTSAVLALFHNLQIGLLASKMPGSYRSII